MTESEFLSLALSKYESIKSLNGSATFYEHEKDFDDIWTPLGKDVLAASVSDKEGPKRKKSLMTRYGTIEISKGHRYFSGSGNRQSPYLQELSVYFGQFTCYASAEEIFSKVLRIAISDSTIFRQTNQVGQHGEVSMPEDFLRTAQDSVAYGMVDGWMILTREPGWKEVKVGRIFLEGHHGQVSKDRNGISHSIYRARLGGHKDFEEHFSTLLDPLVRKVKTFVFISDGARWIRDYISDFYPQAIQIIDFYHVKEHIAKFAKISKIEANKRTGWIEDISKLLLDSDLESVIAQINQVQVAKKAYGEKVSLLHYLTGNAYRMDYKYYRSQGWLIGSGPIEAAQRTVVQQRLKLSGQRWTIKNAQNILNLRASNLSNQCKTVIQVCKNAA
jgi:hypothetical protein